MARQLKTFKVAGWVTSPDGTPLERLAQAVAAFLEEWPNRKLVSLPLSSFYKPERDGRVYAQIEAILVYDED